MSSVFDPKKQARNMDSKIVVGLERIAEAFKVSLWNENKKYGLSPIQLQIMTFLLYHSSEHRTISNIAIEFHTTKPTVSDSVKTLEQKGLIVREKSREDFRVSFISLTEKGQEIARDSSEFANQIEEVVASLPENKKEAFLEGLMEILHGLFNKDIISIQRMCLNCDYNVKVEGSDTYICTLLNRTLKASELKLDCAAHK